MALPVIAKVALLATGLGVGGTLAYKAHAKAKGLPAKPTGKGGVLPPAQGGNPAPPGVPPQSVPVSPPGAPQQPGIVTPPPNSASASDPVHAAAAALVQYLISNPCTQQSFAACSSFQGAFNAVSSTKLVVDGKYGPKSQAALQSVIAPAIAPPNCFPETGATAAVPMNPAPPPNPNVDVYTAASNLVAMKTIPRAAIAQVTTFQHAWNAHGGSTHLVEDGKYGPLSQGALQATINAMGSGQAAPKNPYGPAPTSIPTF